MTVGKTKITYAVHFRLFLLDSAADSDVVGLLPKGKLIAETALQIDEKRRNVKGKGEKESYTHLNAGFQK